MPPINTGKSRARNKSKVDAIAAKSATFKIRLNTGQVLSTRSLDESSSPCISSGSVGSLLTPPHLACC